MATDEICTICKEPKSTHVKTEKGPFTHPKEARGEGIYVLEGSGTSGFGVDCSICRGPCNHHAWQKWVFKPYPAPVPARDTRNDTSPGSDTHCMSCGTSKQP